MGLGPNTTTHFFLKKCLVEHPSSKISSFFFTFALDTHVRIVIPETWRCRKVCFVRIRVMTLFIKLMTTVMTRARMTTFFVQKSDNRNPSCDSVERRAVCGAPPGHW